MSEASDIYERVASHWEMAPRDEGRDAVSNLRLHREQVAKRRTTTHDDCKARDFLRGLSGTRSARTLLESSESSPATQPQIRR